MWGLSLFASELHDFGSLSNWWKSPEKLENKKSWRLRPLGFAASGLPSEHHSGALSLPLTTVLAPSKLSDLRGQFTHTDPKKFQQSLSYLFYNMSLRCKMFLKNISAHVDRKCCLPDCPNFNMTGSYTWLEGNLGVRNQRTQQTVSQANYLT